MNYETTIDGKTDSKASDFEVFNNVMTVHNQLLDYAEVVRKKGKLPKQNLNSIADHIAEENGMIKYKGLYVYPKPLITKRIKDLINKRHNG